MYCDVMSRSIHFSPDKIEQRKHCKYGVHIRSNGDGVIVIVIVVVVVVVVI